MNIMVGVKVLEWNFENSILDLPWAEYWRKSVRVRGKEDRLNLDVRLGLIGTLYVVLELFNMSVLRRIEGIFTYAALLFWSNKRSLQW